MHLCKIVEVKVKMVFMSWLKFTSWLEFIELAGVYKLAGVNNLAGFNELAEVNKLACGLNGKGTKSCLESKKLEIEYYTIIPVYQVL